MILHKHFGVGNYAERLAEIQAHELYNEDMHSHIEDYSNFVMEQYNTAKGHTKDAVLPLEQHLDRALRAGERPQLDARRVGDAGRLTRQPDRG